ncbi:MAG: helix-turn-helix domain-containing protein [Alphaproteobacteria bacterium]
MHPQAYRVSEFCELYKISKTTFYKEINEQRLHILKCGRRTLIARPEAERWFASLSQAQNT